MMVLFNRATTHSDKNILPIALISPETPLLSSSETSLVSISTDNLDEKPLASPANTSAPSPPSDISINISSPSSSQTQSTISINIDSSLLTTENPNISINIGKNSTESPNISINIGKDYPAQHPLSAPLSQADSHHNYPVITAVTPSTENILSIPAKSSTSSEEITTPPLLTTDTPSESPFPEFTVPVNEHTEDLSIAPSSPEELSLSPSLPEITTSFEDPSSKEISSELLFSIQEPSEEAAPILNHSEETSLEPLESHPSLEETSPIPSLPAITIPSEEPSSEPLFSMQKNSEEAAPILNHTEETSLEPLESHPSLEETSLTPDLPAIIIPSEEPSSEPLFSMQENSEQVVPTLNNTEKPSLTPLESHPSLEESSLTPDLPATIISSEEPSSEPLFSMQENSEQPSPEKPLEQTEQSILLTPPSNLVSSTTSTTTYSKKSISLTNQQSALSSLAISLEFKAGHFFFTDALMRSIYTDGGLSLQLCGSFPVWKWLEIYTSVGYQQRSGHSLNMKEPTKIWQIPIDLALKPMIKITSQVQYYFAVGPRYFYVQQHNHSAINNQKVTYNNVGFFVNTGCNLLPCKHLLIDVFAEYSFERMSFKSTDLTIHSRTAQIGGFLIGLGFGYSF